MAATAAFVTSASATTAANAESWTCSFLISSTKTQAVASYAVSGNVLIETWANGTTERFRLIEHNEHGIVAISALAAVEPGQTTATVGFHAVAIDARTRQAWFAATSAGHGPDEMDQGTCIRGQ
jgi:hypothetical protein